jgi:hypothetical protein
MAASYADPDPPLPSAAPRCAPRWRPERLCGAVLLAEPERAEELAEENYFE